ncbi:aa3-type cytochrome oxidase subunit CtaJ [Gordonia soli]|uniref:Uncharacterized protein n=1 Tax=Gordonia soli NBRC 108243 TaxID=1223545 RepID=M0QKU2_9ACTN|nr:hypothetical protein [Gordonia soli]GAC69064.1 hypothetical protein GS4_20_01290 [Gordonia soli NBRC 108243]
MDSLIVAIGVPVTILTVISVVACVVAMAFAWGVKYPKPGRYTLDQQWDSGPLLFSATEIVPMTVGHHFAPTDVEGGSASGKW